MRYRKDYSVLPEKLHDSVKIEIDGLPISIIRVKTGWIYVINEAPVFVPGNQQDVKTYVYSLAKEIIKAEDNVN